MFSGNNSDTKAFCLQVTEGGEWQLSRKYAYYYQVQTQIYVCLLHDTIQVQRYRYANKWDIGTVSCASIHILAHLPFDV